MDLEYLTGAEYKQNKRRKISERLTCLYTAILFAISSRFHLLVLHYKKNRM